jgi:3D (Asp-Asp-Asp) domain-containing protein
VSATPTSAARQRRRRQRVRIATYLVAGAAAWWFIGHPARFPGPPPADVTVADSSSADGIDVAATAGADTPTVPPSVDRLPAPTLPPALVPKGRLFRRLEERARAGERIAVSVTAYCLQGRTRRGNLVRDGIIAVDPKLFPLGREVDLFFGRRMYGRFLADDTGGVIKGGRIDVWMADCDAARRFGRRRGYAQLVRRGG